MDKASEAAREKLEKAGGTLVLRERQSKVALKAMLKDSPKSVSKAS